jgi:hypothetical protein
MLRPYELATPSEIFPGRLREPAPGRLLFVPARDAMVPNELPTGTRFISTTCCLTGYQPWHDRPSNLLGLILDLDGEVEVPAHHLWDRLVPIKVRIVDRPT